MKWFYKHEYLIPTICPANRCMWTYIITLTTNHEFYIIQGDILSSSLGKYTTYHPCVIIIQYNSKKGLLTT